MMEITIKFLSEEETDIEDLCELVDYLRENNWYFKINGERKDVIII